ncbi:TetR/AcrR family transcriptional regulator [Galbibacter pacificus]|uniref:TetR/AcrR family transcriptional regulator n=1 Tax=Galbibacter pacificus TaxID=2996052 RepID=A0ABT6FRU7_9FLAO|nr:TetR/AcrR family transcriptional regulator [Galbibacter pacificus]MDG3582893.1 TetR/AcrR family transcriptional regulator [Galbibacter pacificus]MDG3585988.1 TetR/AcrR family transcriptional regulator [Galbibacter pacificus]
MPKKESILIASLKLIVQKGLHAVTMAEIAKEAKVGIGTIYKHFKDKEDIVQQLWIFQKQDESEFIFKDYIVEGIVKERFWFLWEKVIQYFISHHDEYYFSYHFAASPILTKEIHNIAMKDFLAFDVMFEEGLKEGLFKENMSARHLRLYTFSTINGWILWSFDQKIDFTDEKIDQFITMAWDAIKG